ncbi:MFS transporter [Lysinibacillus sphaericus]|uniref:MFS transporter n=1 Tax=Lysinibacillus sphaericus TaxID=1421 RepID=UPI0018CD30A8|nr:MFS transporter [Lysinibacillus sphaericus]MBG9452629.1 MFS transporter [Lysinibacillus sphaericus]MBG9479113.1 MFS transporter [Lysinibacillus sphaericus]MBG9591297.1 MFS transporter [Lysinibacillus sphaericus]
MKNVLLLALGMFALGFDAYVIAGLLPGISDTFQKSTSQVGQAVSIFTLFYAISAPLFSSLLAGKPIKKILIWSMLLFTIANSVTALAPTFSILLLSRAIAGTGAGLFSPLAVAASTKFISSEKKGRALGLTIGGMSMGTVLGVPLGIYISNVFDWKVTLWLLVIIGGISVLCMIIFLPDFPTTPPPALKERFKMFLDKRVTITVCITFFASVASLGLYTYLSPLLEEMTSSSNLTIYLWAWGFGGLVGSIMIGYIIDYYGRPKILVSIILFSLTLAIICIPLMLKLPILRCLPFFVWGAMGWACQAPQQHILLSYQPNNGSSAVALNSSINYLGSAIGASLGGIVLSLQLGTITLIYFAVISMSFSIGLQFYSMKKKFSV